MPLIVCENLSLSYEGRCVLENLSFRVNAGDYLCIVGENGSGKSTLLKALLSLKSPEQGKISFGDGLRQSQVGYLPQQREQQRNFPASVGEIVLSGCLNSLGLRPFYARTARQRAEAYMEKLGLSALARRPFGCLSGGQQQRVLLCRALCAAERMLLLDEPAAGLDPVVTEELYQLVRDANREGLTVITVSHDMTAVRRDASHILHLAGKPLFFGAAADYAASPLGQAFLGGSHA